MPMDLESLLETALTTHGYKVEQAPPLEGRSGATYPATLLAQQDETRYLVDASLDPVTENDVDALGAIVDDTGIDAAILFALDDQEPPQGASSVHVWPRPRFEAALGRNLLAEALDADPDPIGPLDDDRIDAPTRNDANDPHPTPRAPPSDQPARSPEPQPQPASAQPSPPQPDPPSNGADPAPQEPSTQPQNAPEPAAADPGSDPDTFVSPEEMAERAQQMLEQGEIPDDGDAEILTDDDASPNASPSTPEPPLSEPQDEQPEAQGGPSPPQEAQDEAPDPSPGPQEEPLQEGQVFEDADCELLPSKPKDQREPEQPAHEPRPDPDPEPPSQAPPQPDTADPGTDETPLAAIAADADQDQQTFLSGGCLEPRITEQQARNEAQGALFNVQDARLELLPFHVFDYRCQLEGDGTTREAEGRLWVSAQNGAIVQDPDGTLVDDPGTPHERYQPQLRAQAAVHEAKNHLTDALERREELREDYSETAIIERVTLVPQEDTLQLDHQGTAYAPRWRLEGQNGTVFVDALTGDLVAS